MDYAGVLNMRVFETKAWAAANSIALRDKSPVRRNPVRYLGRCSGDGVGEQAGKGEMGVRTNV